MGVSDSFQRYLIDPFVQQFTSLFDLNGRLGLLFLGVSYAVAYLLFRYRRQHGLTQAMSFWAFLGGWRVHWHPSARLDYRYYFVRGVLKVALVVPIVALVDPYTCVRATTSPFSRTSGVRGRKSGRTFRWRCSTGSACSSSVTSPATGCTGRSTAAGCGNFTRCTIRHR